MKAAEQVDPEAPNAKRPRPVYRYGNYSAYYGYRVGPSLEDERLLAMSPEWFEGRRCLDIGCNEGLVTLSLAVKYRPASFEGVDIDSSLVRRALAKLRCLQRASADAAAEAALLLPGEALRTDRAALSEAGHALAAVSFRRALSGPALSHQQGTDPARPGAAISWTRRFRLPA
jgi:7SK snRNA methylphosphate capping enzyme